MRLDRAALLGWCAGMALLGFAAGRAAAPAPEDLGMAGDPSASASAPGAARGPKPARRPPAALGARAGTGPYASAPDAPDAPGWIRGTVTDEGGHPVAGARLEACAAPAPRAPASAGPPSREDAIRDLHAEYRTFLATRRAAESGPDGQYRIDGLPEGRVDVHAEAPGYQLLLVEAAPREGLCTGQVIDWQARDVGEVLVHIAAPDGQAPAHAFIVFRRIVGDTNEAIYHDWSTESRIVRLGPGRWRMNLDGELWAPQRDLDVRLGEPQEVLVQTEAAPVLFGRVRLPPPIVGAGAFVRALRLDPGGPATTTIAAVSRLGLRAECHDQEGGFRLHCPPGRYALMACWDPGIDPPGEPWWTSDPILVDLGAGPTEVALDLPAPPLERALVLRLEDPLPGDRVWLDHSAMSDEITVRLADGAYAFIPLTERAGAHAARIIRVDSLRSGVREVAVPEGASEATVRLGAAAVVHVVLEGYAGSGHEGRLDVGLARPGGNDPTHGYPDDPHSDGRRKVSSVLTAEGDAWLGPLEPGTYDASVLVRAAICPRASPWDLLIAGRTPVALVPGHNEVRLAIPPLYPLEVRRPEGEVGDTVTVRPLDGARGGEGLEAPRSSGASFDPTTDTAWFERLPAGRYEVRCEMAGEARVLEVAVPASGPVDLADAAPPSPPAPRLDLRDASSGGLVRLGFEHGDRLVAVAGAPVDDPPALLAAARAALAEEGIEVEVERAGQRVRLRLSVGALLEAHGDRPWSAWSRR